MRVFLVHHADAVGPDVDPQRPLSALGWDQAEALAERAREAGYAPAAIWHSGKLRARQTAEAFLRRSPFAEFAMVRGLRPDDPPEAVVEAVRAESRDVMVVGHLPNLSAIIAVLAPAAGQFPSHGLVALEPRDGRWVPVGRLE